MTIVSVIQGNLYLQRNRQIFKPFFHRAFSYFCGGYGIIAEVQQNRIISHTTQVDNGSQVFSVKTKRIQWEGQDAFIEYATDITAVSRAQQIFETQLDCLLTAAEQQLSRLCYPAKDGDTLHLSTSLGAVYCDAPAPRYPALLELADKALYCAKERGRRQHCIWRLSDQRSS